MRGSARSVRWSAVHHAATRGAILVLAGLLLLAPPLAAQTPDYTLRGIPAEATAENGVVARDRALASARRIAWGRIAGEAVARGMSDSAIEALVESIIIEEERIAPTRYVGVVTVNFRRGRAQQAVAQAADPNAPVPPAPRTGPAVASVEATARYAGLTEWLEIRRRLVASPEVATIEVTAISTDRARLRLGLRAAPAVAAPDMARAGLLLAPQGGAPGADAWRVGPAAAN